MGLLANLQTVLAKFITNAGDFVKADAQAILTQLDAELAAGTITKDVHDQQYQFPTNVITLVNMIEQMIGTPLPSGAGPLYVLFMLQKLNPSGAQLQTLNTQIKLVIGEGQAMLKMPGLPF